MDAPILGAPPPENSIDFEDVTAAEIVAWALERFSPRVSLACQAEESVLIDLMHRARGAVSGCLPLDNGRLNEHSAEAKF